MHLFKGRKILLLFVCTALLLMQIDIQVLGTEKVSNTYAIDESKTKKIEVEGVKEIGITTTDTSSTIVWEEVYGAVDYDIEVDGIIVGSEKSTSYIHENLTDNTEYLYRVRGKNEESFGDWSPQTKALTKLSTPQNIKIMTTELGNKVVWEEVYGATGYDIEIDGEIAESVDSTSYLHSKIGEHQEYSYRVRATSESNISNWTEFVTENIIKMDMMMGMALLGAMQGSGTVGDPFIITTRAQLEEIQNNLGAHYKLNNDIDLENIEWTPIGSRWLRFTGSLDGNGYTISNLKIDKGTTDYVGLFASIDGATMKNIRISNININASSYVGALAGYALNNFDINNCILEGVGIVKGEIRVGGLIGGTSNGGRINNCVSKIRVEGSSGYIGGLIGVVSKIQELSKNYATGDVTGSEASIGGLIGYASSCEKISENYSIGNVSGSSRVGGLIGCISDNSSIRTLVENCFALGNVSSTSTSASRAGGLIGDVTGYTGNNSVLKNSYSAGKVITRTTGYTGGALGYVRNIEITNLYYDGVSSGYPQQNNYERVTISKLTSGMKLQNTFIGWNFTNTWSIDEGKSYPYLRSLDKPLEVVDGLPENDVSDGKGTIEAPYIITTLEQLNNIKFDLNSHYKLGNNIDMQNTEWTPIGGQWFSFTGSLDGDGYTIGNLKINKGTTNFIGLFGAIDGATIKNIRINNVNINGKEHVGALAGSVDKNFLIDNCIVEGVGIVKGEERIGGLIGNTKNGGRINNCVSKIRVDGSSRYVGGLVGVVGKIQELSKSYATGDVTGDGNVVGGLIGAASSCDKISESYSVGNVSGNSRIGGLIGWISDSNSGRTLVENCFALGDVSSTHTSSSRTGGLIGDITGYVGNNSVLKDSYSAGKVTTNTDFYTGGLVGYFRNVVMTNVYYDSTTTGMSQPTSQARTTSELLNSNTFIGWDFNNMWDIKNGSSYPYLRNLEVPDHDNLPNIIDKIRFVTTSITPNSVTLSWNAIDGATGYDVEIDGIIIDNGISTSYIHSNLEPGTEHNYRVRAKNSYGEGEWSELITAVTSEIQLIIPQNIIVSKGFTRIVLTWDEVMGATGYDIEVDGVVVDNGNSTIYIHDFLTPNTAHTYRVRSKNSYAQSEWSNLLNISTTAIEPPSNINKIESSTKITITWDHFNEATGYDIEVDGVVIDNGIDTSYIHSRLIPETQHTYRVRTRSGSYVSDWSLVINAVTSNNPIIITTRSQLEEISNNLDEYYILGNDIDLENVDWTPIGTSNTPFIGYFNGNGFKIKNVKVNGDGLFGHIDGAKIYNLEINNVNVQNNYQAGGLVGVAKNYFTIENCHVTGSGNILGKGAGGLIGSATEGNVVNSSSAARVESMSQTGGLIGLSKETMISRCHASGNVESTTYESTGGLIGQISGGSIDESYATGNVTGRRSVGGLVGLGANYEVNNCFALGDVSANYNNNTYSGGLIGRTYENTVIKNSYSTGKVYSDSGMYHSDIGGIVGSIESSAQIINCYYDGVLSQHKPTKDIDISRLTTDMKREANYESWDFNNTWNIDEGNSYPYLKNMSKPLEVTTKPPVGDVAGGLGTIESPFIISTKEQLNNLNYYPEGNYKMSNDIDLENMQWTPIGAGNRRFKGSLDGAGYTIKNLNIVDQDPSARGLFSYIDGAKIKNINIKNVNINSDEYNVGALVGHGVGRFLIDNCSVNGLGKVKGQRQVGGLIGYAHEGTISNCSAEIDVEGNTYYIGGLIGLSYATVSRCYATGDVSTTDRYNAHGVGGLIGTALLSPSYEIANISESYATGNVEGLYDLGGLIGILSGYDSGKPRIENCFAMGNVTAFKENQAYAGGLIGRLIGSDTKQLTVKNCYSRGEINANGSTSFQGGLIGYQLHATIISSYFDSITGYLTPSEQARTGEELMSSSTFVDWDLLNTWNIDEGNSFPYLRNVVIPSEIVFKNIKVIDINSDSITLHWESISWADEYEIEVDGKVINAGTDNTYKHIGLESGTKYEYKIRGKSAGINSTWSQTISAVTLIDIPENINISSTSDSITISWDSVGKATQYEIEVDGNIINNGSNITYIHSNLTANTQHVYRVKAKNSLTNSKWTDPIYDITWLENGPAVSLASTSWLTKSQETGDIQIVLKANGFNDMYTAHFELDYDPQVIQIKSDTIKDLIGEVDGNSYLSYKLDNESGKLKLITSKTGKVLGKEGQFDITNMTINLNRIDAAVINISNVKIVDSDGEYIQVPDVNPLNIIRISDGE